MPEIKDSLERSEGTKENDLKLTEIQQLFLEELAAMNKGTVPLPCNMQKLRETASELAAEIRGLDEKAIDYDEKKFEIIRKILILKNRISANFNLKSLHFSEINDDDEYEKEENGWIVLHRMPGPKPEEVDLENSVEKLKKHMGGKKGRFWGLV